MNATKAKYVRKFMKINMGIDPNQRYDIYRSFKNAILAGSVMPLNNYKIGDKVEFTFDTGIKKQCIVSTVDGFNQKTGELILKLKEIATDIAIDSFYDRNRRKL